MRVSTVAALLLVAPVFVVGGAGVASAGEVTGPPEDGFATGGPTGIWGHATSECAFSGLNALHPGKPATQTQSYGTLVKMGLKAVLPSPGQACNGHLAPMDWGE